MTITKPADVLDALEVLLGRIHCAAQNAGFDTLIDVDLSFSQLKTLLVLSQSTESLPIHEIADWSARAWSTGWRTAPTGGSSESR